MSSLREKLTRIWKEDVLLRRVLRNTSYLFSSQAIGMVLAMVQSVLAAHLLGVRTLGILFVIMTFTTNVNRLFSFRMGEFIIKFMGKELVKKDAPRAAAIVKVAGLTEGTTSILAFVIYMLLVPIGARYFAKDMTSLSLFYLYGLFILANITTETATGILQVTNRFKVQAWINLSQSIFTAGLITFAFFTKGSLLLVVWAYLIGKFITGLGPIVAAWVTLNRKFGKDWLKAPFSLLPSFKEMAKFTVSTNLSGTVKMLVSESEPLLIGLLLNTEAVALYKIAINIVNPLTIPISQFINTTYPEMTKSIAARKWQELSQLLRRVTLISASWTVLFFLVMLFFGPWILSIWGADYVPAYATMMILIVGYGISNIFFWNRTLLLSFGKANIPLYIMAAVALVKTGLAFVFVPNHGIQAEAALLSGNFAVSVGALVLIGVLLIRRSKKANEGNTEPAI
ncbi:MAG: oligosaccharide flippase family protein [Anaerolineaceae bacterium]